MCSCIILWPSKLLENNLRILVFLMRMQYLGLYMTQQDTWCSNNNIWAFHQKWPWNNIDEDFIIKQSWCQGQNIVIKTGIKNKQTNTETRKKTNRHDIIPLFSLYILNIAVKVLVFTLIIKIVWTNIFHNTYFVLERFACATSVTLTSREQYKDNS